MQDEQLEQHVFHHLVVSIKNQLIAHGVNDNDRIRVVITHQGLDRAMNLPMVRRANLDVERIISKIEFKNYTHTEASERQKVSACH